MRFNSRKILIISSLLIILWLTLFYTSTMEVSNPLTRKNNMEDLNIEVERLKMRMDQELEDGRQFLSKMKSFIEKKNEEEMDDKNSKGSESALVLPILVMACNRVTVKRCLDNLVKYRPSKDIFPIIVSQDCGHNATYHVIKTFVDSDRSISVVRQPDLSEIALPKSKVKFAGYYKIARHFKFALNHVFRTLGHEAVIIVEDDLDISPDFFEYFLGTYDLLLMDSTIWCISAWNDNGKKSVIDLTKPELLHRTDFFPGLGWMLRKETWDKLAPKWPPAFFDDWLRDPKNTEGKACVRPEVSRTYSFGKVGVSKGLFFDNHLKHMHLNTKFVPFTKMDLTYLTKKNYDPWLQSQVEEAKEMTAEQAVSGAEDSNARVLYGDAIAFRRAAKVMGLMDDFRSGIPRTAYKGIVQCSINNRRIFLTPSFPWTHYDPSWG